jgi:outer membrane protein TolC
MYSIGGFMARFSYWIRFPVAFSCGLAAATIFAQPLSLAEAVDISAQRSRQLTALTATASSARQMAVAAGQRPDPLLRLGINNLPIDGPDRLSVTRDFMTMRSIGVMQEFTRADKLTARTQRFEQEALTSEAGQTAARAALRRDTALAWLDVHYIEQAREVMRRQRDEAQLQIEAALSALRAARGTQTDVFMARTSAAQLDDKLNEADREVTTARIALARWVGDAGQRALGSLPAMDVPLLHEHSNALPARLAEHPQLQLMRQQEAVAQAEVVLAETAQQTDWTAELMLSQRGPAFSNMLSFNVSVPLQMDRAQRQGREVTARQINLERLRDEREEALRSHVTEAQTLLAHWRSNRERLMRYDQELLPLTADRLRAALATYRGGSGTLASVLEARRSEIDIQLDRLRLARDTARLWAQLNYLLPIDGFAKPVVQ